METEKYKLTEETINVMDRTLHRIEALRDFSNVKKGDKGGFVENERNLSQYDDCWIFDNAKVFGNAEVYDNAKVFDNALVFSDAIVYNKAEVFGNAEVYDNAKVFDNALVFSDAKVFGNARVCSNAIICGNAIITSNSDYIVFKNWWSSGRSFTWTRSNNMWTVGCFYGTGEELIEKAYNDSELSGREYKRVVDYVKSILNQ